MPFRLKPKQLAYKADMAARMRFAQLQTQAANAEAAALAADKATTAQAEIDRQRPGWRHTKRGRAAQAWTQRWRDFAPAFWDADAVDEFNALPSAAADQ